MILHSWLHRMFIHSYTLMHNVTSFSFFLFNQFYSIYQFRDGWRGVTWIFSFMLISLYVYLVLRTCPNSASIYLRELNVKRGHQNLPWLWLRASITLWAWPITFGDISPALSFEDLFTVQVTIVSNHGKKHEKLKWCMSKYIVKLKFMGYQLLYMQSYWLWEVSVSSSPPCFKSQTMLKNICNGHSSDTLA